MAKAEHYEVGYGKPPQSGQWKKGQSGNPSGKKKPLKAPPAQPLLEHLAAELSELVTITAQGKQEKIPYGAALAKKLLHDIMAAPVKEKLKALEFLEKLGVFNLQAALIGDLPDDDWLSEEDRMILAAINGDDEAGETGAGRVSESHAQS